MKHFFRAYWPALLFVIAGFAMYGTSLNNSFLLDDEAQILHNDLIHSPSNLTVFFSGATMHQEGTSLGGIYYKPIMSTLYSVMWWADPGNPLLFHLLQLLIAIANAWLLFVFLRRMMSERAALLMSVVYLVHPLNTEVVTYIADLQDVLYTFFGLLALNMLARPGVWRFREWLGFTLLLLCSMLSKESGVLYLIITSVYVICFRRDLFKRVVVCVACTAAVYLYLRIEVANLSSLSYSMNQIGRATAFTRLMTAPLVMSSYFWKFIFPRDISATQDWVVTEATFMDLWLPLVALSVILILAVWYSIRTFKGKKGSPHFAFFAYWTFMGTGFHSHIIAALDGTTADRWFYFTFIGVVGMLGLLIDRFALTKAPRVTAVVIGVAAVLLAVRSHVRSYDWENNYVLCLHDLTVSPNSYDLHNNLGVELFRRGKIDEAKVEFEKSVELTPIWDVSWNNLGATHGALGNLKQAEESYLRSINNGNYYLAYENYAKLLVSQRRFAEAKKFISERALPRFPASKLLKALNAEAQAN